MTRKLTKNYAYKMAKEITPILNNYIEPWDRDYQPITIKDIAETILCDMDHLKYSLEEIHDQAIALEDFETARKISSSALWAYKA